MEVDAIFTVLIPMRTVSAPNVREHHMARARRVKAERWAAGMVLNGKDKPQLPCVVVLSRCSPARQRLDDDNLRGSLKAVRDEVARWLGVDDGGTQVRWVYRQERAAQWGVEISMCSDEVQ